MDLLGVNLPIEEVRALKKKGEDSGAHANIESYFLEREEYMDDYYKRFRNYFEFIKKEGLHLKPKDPRAKVLSHSNFNLFFGPLGLHTGAFIPTIEMLGTQEQIEKWAIPGREMKLIGAYAQTELGHGSDVQSLETLAIYHPKSQEFELHSPTLTSTKFWPGVLGKSATHAVVQA